MYLFAYLMTLGYKIDTVVKNKKRYVFHVIDKSTRIQDVKNYYNNAPIPVLTFKNAVQSVRAIIRDIAYKSWTKFEDVEKT